MENKQSTEIQESRAPYSPGIVDDLNGLVPIGYEITPWGKLFSSLDVREHHVSKQSLLLAKVYTFYYRQLQFNDYLTFLGQLGNAYPYSVQVANSKIYFSSLLQQYFLGEGISIGILDQIESKKIKADDLKASFTKVVKDFLSKFKSLHLDTNGVVNISKVVYQLYKQFFKKSHYNFLTKYPFGYLFLLDFGNGNSFFSSDIPAKGKLYGAWQDEKPLNQMLSTAVRQYPALHPDGEVQLLSYNFNNRLLYDSNNYDPNASNSNNTVNPAEFSTDDYFHDLRHGKWSNCAIGLDLINIETTGKISGTYQNFQHYTAKKEGGYMKFDNFIGMVKNSFENENQGLEIGREEFVDNRIFVWAQPSLSGVTNKAPNKVTFVPVTEESVYDTGVKIRGDAMWNKYPFEAIYSLLDIPKMNR